MPDINPYRPATTIPNQDDHQPDDGRWAYRRIAVASSAFGTLLVAVSVLRFIAGAVWDPTLLLLSGLGFIASGYYWYGRDTRQAIGWSLISFSLLGALVLLG